MTSIVQLNQSGNSNWTKRGFDSSRLPFRLDKLNGFSNLSTMWNYVGSNSTPGFGALLQFDIPAQPAFLTYMYVQLTVSAITNSGSGAFAFQDDFSYINQYCNILSNGQNELVRYDYAALPMHYITNEPLQVSLSNDSNLGRNLTLSQRAALATGTQTFYIRIPWSADPDFDEHSINDAYRLFSVRNNLRVNMNLRPLQDILQIASGSPTAPVCTIQIAQLVYQTYVTPSKFMDELKIKENNEVFRTYTCTYTDYSIQSGITSTTIQLANQSGLLKRMIFMLRPTSNLNSGSSYTNNLSLLSGPSVLSTFQFSVNGTPFVLTQNAQFNINVIKQTYAPDVVYGSYIYLIPGNESGQTNVEDSAGFIDVTNSNLQLQLNFASSLGSAYTCSVMMYFLGLAAYRDGALVVSN